MGSQGKRMSPSKALQSDSNYQDLEFLTEIKDEVLVSPRNNTSPIISGHEQDHSELSVYLGMRRNSSFADYFEGDLSQNLLSRRHFNESSSTKSGLISTLVNKIRAEGQTRSKVEGDGMLGRSCETMMPSHWFFINRKLVDSEKELAPVQRRRAFTTPTQSGKKGEEEEEDSTGRKPSSLSKIISNHFSATRDVRAFN